MQHEFRLETERLVLRGWREADREANWAMNCDEEVMRYLPAKTREESDAAIDRTIAMQAVHGHSIWVVECKQDGGFIGACGIMTPREPTQEYELGWRLARAAWGQGHASEAARATLAWAWANIATDAIVAITVPANVASWRVMERIGMTRCPEEDFDHPELSEGDPLRPHILYRIHRPA